MNTLKSWRDRTRWAGAIGLGFLVLGLLPVRQALAAPPSTPGPVQGTPSPAKLPPADLIIYVNPISSTTAYVGMVYRSRITHARARAEIGRLTQGTGWQIGKLQIEDSSPRPDNLKRFPKTTGAEILLQEAPQIQDGAPALQPYVRAFQAWNHLEVMFRLSASVTSREQDFGNNAMDIHLSQDRDVYRYEIDIHDHAGPLPVLTASASSPATGPEVAAEPAGRPAAATSSLALLLIATGAGLAAFAGLWLVYSRRSVSGVSARTFRQ